MPPTVLVTAESSKFLWGSWFGLLPYIIRGLSEGGVQAVPTRVGWNVSTVGIEMGCRAAWITLTSDDDKLPKHRYSKMKTHRTYRYLFDTCRTVCKSGSEKNAMTMAYLTEFLWWPPVILPSFEPISAIMTCGFFPFALPQSRIVRAYVALRYTSRQKEHEKTIK